MVYSWSYGILTVLQNKVVGGEFLMASIELDGTMEVNGGIDESLDRNENAQMVQQWWKIEFERNIENGIQETYYVCLKCSQETHQKYTTKGYFAKHLDRCHSRHFAGDEHFKKCNNCQRYFCGDKGYQKHLPNCKGAEIPRAPEPSAAGSNVDMIGIDVESGDMFFKEEYQTATFFLRYFRQGLYETSEAVLELYGVAFIHLLGETGKSNESGQTEQGRWANLLALLVLPGMLSFITKYKVAGSALPLLRRLVRDGENNAGRQLAYRILDEAAKLIRTHWHSGEQPELLERPASKGTVKRHIQRAEEMGRNGRIGAAARECEAADKLLVRDDSAGRDINDTPNPLTFEQQLEVIGRHFPRFRNERLDNLPDISMENEPEGTRVSADHIRQAIESMNKTSAAGPDGTTSRLIAKLYDSLCIAQSGNDAKQKEMVDALHVFTQGLADGRFGKHSMELLNMVRVAIFGEKRVIGIRSAIMRLALKAIILANAAQQDVSLPFRETAQLCVGVSGGTMIAAKILQDAYDREVENTMFGDARDEKDDEGNDVPGSRQYLAIDEAGAAPAILSTDVSKCFQHIAIAAVYEEMKTKGLNKGLVRVFRSLYGNTTILLNSKGKIVGRREIGLLQGCIMSMLFNSYGLRRVDEKILGAMGDARRMATDMVPSDGMLLQEGTVRFADDGYIYGSVAVLVCIYPMLEAIYASEGLKLNKDKCCLLNYYSSRGLMDVEVLTRSGGDCAARLAEFLPECKIADHGMIALGVPIGTPRYVNLTCKQFVEKTLVIPVDAMSRINPQLAMSMIVLVYNTQADYMFNAIAPHLSRDGRQLLDLQIDTAIRAILQIDWMGSPEHVYAKWLRGIPTYEGGLGIRRKDHPNSVLAAIINHQKAINYVAENMPHRKGLMGIGGVDASTELTSYDYWAPHDLPHPSPLKRWKLNEEELTALSRNDITTITRVRRECVTRYEKEMAEGLHDYVLHTRLDNARAAVFLSNRNKRSCTWILTSGGPPFHPAAYLAFLRHRVLQPLQSVADGRRIDHCGYCAAYDLLKSRNALKANFAHASSCVHCTGYTQRHDAIVDILATYCNKLIPGDCQVTKEQFVVGGSAVEAVVEQMHNGRPTGPRRGGQAGVRMDLVVTIGDKEYWIDVAVVDPGCKTYLDKGSATIAGAAAKDREADKRNRLKQKKPDFNMEGNTPKFIPFVLEVSGKMGESAKKFVQTVGLPGPSIRRLQHELGAILARHTGFMLWNTRMKCNDAGRSLQLEAEVQRSKRRRVENSLVGNVEL